MNKQEIKYITFAGLFAFAWFVFILPRLITRLDGNNPFMQFMVFNMGLYIFFFIFLKVITINTSFNLRASLGLTSLFLALDILMPEYHVLSTGELVKGATLGVSTSDYIAGLLAQNMGLNGIMIYIFTYFIAPIILLSIAAKIIPNFVRRI